MKTEGVCILARVQTYVLTHVCMQAKASSAAVKTESEWDMPEPKDEDSDSDSDNEGGYSPVLDQVSYFCDLCVCLYVCVYV